MNLFFTFLIFNFLTLTHGRRRKKGKKKTVPPWTRAACPTDDQLEGYGQRAFDRYVRAVCV